MLRPNIPLWRVIMMDKTPVPIKAIKFAMFINPRIFLCNSY